MTNYLYLGDNLDVMYSKLTNGTIDFVYLDPPFNSQKKFSMLTKDKSGIQQPSQMLAYKDTWIFDDKAAIVFNEITEKKSEVSDALLAFEKITGHGKMLAYLCMMAPRLIKIKELLKPTGSVYLHCDSTASHYLKILMDSVFGYDNFRNEIIWEYPKGIKSSTKKEIENHDVIFGYAKDISQAYFVPTVVKYTEKQLARYKHEDDGGRYYFDTRRDKDQNKKQVKVYLHKEGTPAGDVWYFNFVQGKKRRKFETEKPEDLIHQIIISACPPNGVVLDPFCGCGPGVSVPAKLGLNWIGIDISVLQTQDIIERLSDDGFILGKDYLFDGLPTDMNGAELLSTSDKYQFQNWALSLVGATPTMKKGKDNGIDGWINFRDPSGAIQRIVCSVKGGGVSVSQIRDLVGVVNTEKAVFGLFITLREPTGPMRNAAVSAPPYVCNGEHYHKVQIYTIEDYFNGKILKIPKINNIIETKKEVQRTL